MPLVISADTDRINFVHLKHFVVTGEDVLSGDTPLIGSFVCLAFDDVAYSDDLETADLRVSPLMRTRNTTCTHNTDSNRHKRISS